MAMYISTTLGVWPLLLNVTLLVVLVSVVIFSNNGVGQTEEDAVIQYDGLLEEYFANENGQKPSAHVVIEGSAHVVKEGYTGVDVTLSWSVNFPTSHLHNIRYEDKALVLPNTGFYFVYSQLLYQDPPNAKITQSRFLTHCVLGQQPWQTQESRTILLQNTWHASIQNNLSSYITSSLNGIFYLEANSTVSVTSSNPDSIIISPYSSYFGLFLI